MKMKHIFTTGLFAGSLLMGTSAFAEGETPVVPDTTGTVEVTKKTKSTDGITPDSFFYNFDKLAEKLQLLFTNDPEKEADLLLQFANERLAETDEMAAQEKEKYINQLIDDYLLTLQKAQEKVGEVVTNEETNSQVKEDLSTKLEETTSVTEGVEQNLDSDQQTALDEKRQEAYLVANVVKDIDPEKVKTLREQGFGFGEIVKVVSLAEASGKTEDEIVSLIKDGKGYGVVAKELNIEPSQITKKVINNKEKYIEKMIEQAIKAGNEDAVEHLTKSLEVVKRKKVDFKFVKGYVEIEYEIKNELAKIKEKVAAGKIPQEVADRKISKLQKGAAQELSELKDDADEEAIELQEEMEEDLQKAKEEAKEQAKKIEEKKQKEMEKQKKEQEKAEQEKQKQIEKEKKEQEKAEQEKQKQIEKEKKEQEKAEQEKQKQVEKEKKEQEKAEQEKQKQTEKEKKEQEKAAKEANKKEKQKNDDEDED